MRSVLVTGGSGFLGRAIAKRLLAAKQPYLVDIGSGSSWPLPTFALERICIFSRDEHKQAQMRDELGDDKRLRFFVGDVRDVHRLTRAMDGCDAVIHAAALKRVEVGRYNPDEMVKTNLLGAMNVIEAARQAVTGVPLQRRVVLVSTDKAYEPVSPYGQTKALAESLFLSANENSGAYGPKFAVTRYGNVWRSTGSVVPRWQRLLEQGMAVPVTDPDCTRFFMRVDAAVELVLRALEAMPSEVVVPELPAYRLGDLAQAMGAKMQIRGLPPHEKKHESMRAGASSNIAPRMTVNELREELASA